MAPIPGALSMHGMAIPPGPCWKKVGANHRGQVSRTCSKSLYMG
jgi:hypothetical protein